MLETLEARVLLSAVMLDPAGGGTDHCHAHQRLIAFEPHLKQATFTACVAIAVKYQRP